MRHPKIKKLAEIQKISARARKKGLTVVTTNGTFDIVHVGHVRNLQAAKSYGDILIVGINSDASVKKYKGASRPVIPAEERAEVVASLEPVDYVFMFETETAIPWLKKIKPHKHIKGADRKPEQIPEWETLKKMDSELICVPYHKGKSTTNIISKIKSL